jgi:hypothetical protein
MLNLALVLLGCASPPSPLPSSSSAVTSPSPSPSPSPTAAPLSAVRFTASGLERCVPWPYGCLYAVLVRDAGGIVRKGWFEKQLVTDVGSFSPVPSGTPVVSFVQDVLIACSIAIDVAAGAPVTIDVAFTASRCVATKGA